MFRVDTPTAVANLPAQNEEGDPGYFTKGNPSSGLAATVPGQDWFNIVQEELIAIILAAGLTPAKATTNQVLEAIKLLSNHAADTGEANAYAATYSPALTAHAVGVPLSFSAAHANTGASTFNPGPGALAIKRLDGTDLQAGDIPADAIVTVIYTGTNYQIQSIAPPAATRMLPTLGAANLKLFVNAAGELPEWSKGLIVKPYTRANDGASGDESYTGLGFKPSAIIVLAHSPVGKGKFSVGLTDFTSSGSIRGTSQTSDEEVTTFSVSTTYLIAAYDGSTGQTAVPKTANADGFTLTWSSHGSPSSATINFIVLALR